MRSDDQLRLQTHYRKNESLTFACRALIWINSISDGPGEDAYLEGRAHW